jgi:hypothetical protein
MKRLFFTLFIGLLFYTAGAQLIPKGSVPPAEQVKDTSKPTKGIFIQPSSLAFSLNNGQSAIQKITVSNKLSTKSQMKIYMGDWERDTTGQHQYYEPGTLSRSCARWVSVDKDFVEVGPYDSVSFNLRIQVPDSIDAIKEMKWAMLFVEMIKERSAPPVTGKDISAQLNYQYRFGLHVYQTPATMFEKSLKMLSFEPLVVQKDSTVYLMGCLNDGDVQVRCTGMLELTNLSNGAKVTTPVQEFNIFPKARRYVPMRLPRDLPPGKYSVLAMLDGGEDIPLEAVQKEIEIK